MISPVIADAIGVLGMMLILVAYFLMHFNKLLPTSLVYLNLNLWGSTGMILSLVYASWNLAAAFINACWIFISIYGICKACIQKRKRGT